MKVLITTATEVMFMVNLESKFCPKPSGSWIFFGGRSSRLLGTHTRTVSTIYSCWLSGRGKGANR